MITTGKKQLISMTVFFVAAAALGGALFKRREVEIVQQPIEARIVSLEARKKAATDPNTKLRLEAERARSEAKEVIARVDKQLQDIKDDAARIDSIEKELKQAQDAKNKLMPGWLRWTLWGLTALLLISFMVAMNVVTEHGRRFLVTCTIALGAAGFFYFRQVSLGIDLKGGAELRYQLDTSAIDKEIAELEALQQEFEKEPEATAKRIRAEISQLQADYDKATSDVTKVSLNQQIQLLQSYIQKEEGKDGAKPRDGIKDRLALLRQQRTQDVTKAVDVIRKRIDAAGIREISVQTSEAGRLIAQVPVKNILLSKTDIVAKLREKTGASQWDNLDKGRQEALFKEEERRLRLEQLDLDVNALQGVVETPGMLAFHDVDACNGYRRDEDRWQKMVEWDGKIQDLVKELGKTTDKAKQKEIEAKIAALRAKSPAPGYVLREYKEFKEDKGSSGQDVVSERLLLREKPVTTGETLTRAIVIGTQGGGGGLKVLVYLNAVGGSAIANYTDTRANPEMKHKETRMAIMLDGVVKSAPTVQSQLGTDFEITGRFTQEEADQLAQVLNGGSLAFKPVQESKAVVGPGLGEDSISAGIKASLVGSLLVVAFMGVYYLAGGIAANLAMALNLLLILGAMSLLGATMTLPGIAGIALTVGMAVDANVLIFERVREEKARGKPLKLALKAGQDRALITILDSNFTTMIIAFFLYLFGTGPVKGFAVTLTLGLLTNLFTALYVTKAVMEYLHARGWLTEFKMLQVIAVPKISFMKAAPFMGTLSALLVAGSLFLLFTTKNKLGLDFTGGLEIQVRLAAQSDTGKVRAVADRVKDDMEAHLRSMAEEARAKAAKEGRKFSAADQASASIGECSVQAYEPDAAGRSSQFRISCQLDTDQQQVLDKAPAKAGGEPGLRGFFSAGFAQDKIGLDAKDPFPMMSKIGSRAASELQGKAILAFSFSLIAMFFYIVLRFDFMIGFGLGAVLSLFHDAAVAVGALMVANRMGMAGAQIDLVIVAAVLTIIGFSINDTIVIFDRIRENRPAMRSLSLREIVDVSVCQTLSRTILTSTTVFIAVLCLLLLGGGTLRPFSLVFLAGVIVGTYSTVFVATYVGVVYENWRDRRREALKQKLRSAPAQTA